MSIATRSPDTSTLSPAIRRELSRPEHRTYAGLEDQNAAFARLRALRLAAWTAVLAEPRRAAAAIKARPPARLRRDSRPDLDHDDMVAASEEPAVATEVAAEPEHATLTTWLAARRLYLSRCNPRKQEQDAMSAASSALAKHLADADKDDAHLLAVAAHVASHAMPGMPHASATVVVDWTRSVAAALTEYQAVVGEVEGHNLRLVVMLARRCLGWPDARSFTLDDLVGYGFPGLRIAVLRFDPGRGLKFSSFASWWISHTIRRAIQEHGRFMRIPVHALDLLNKIKSTAKRLGKGATDKAIAEIVGVSVDRVAAIRRSAATHLAPPLSLDAPVRMPGDIADVRHTLAEVVSDGSTPIDEAIDGEMAGEFLDRLIADALTPQERFVILRRFGLGGHSREPDKTERAKYAADLADIGVDLGLSRERIRQIQEKALCKMRSAAEAAGMTSATC